MNNTRLSSPFNFQKQLTLAERKKKFDKSVKLYPKRIPCIVEPHFQSNIQQLKKTKYLVPVNMMLSAFLLVLRTKITPPLEQEDALYLQVYQNETFTLPQLTKTIQEIQNEYRSEDGFVYFKIAREATFGKLMET